MRNHHPYVLANDPVWCIPFPSVPVIVRVKVSVCVLYSPLPLSRPIIGRPNLVGRDVTRIEFRYSAA